MDEEQYRRAGALEQQTVTPRLAEGALACLAADLKYSAVASPTRRAWRRRAPRASGGRGRELGAVPAQPPAPARDVGGALGRRGSLGPPPRRGRRADGADRERPQAHFNLALLASHRGESAAARRLADELLAEAAKDGDLWSEASARGLLGLVCGFEGDVAGAAEYLGRWNEVYLQIGLVEPGRRRLMADYLEALVATGGPRRPRRTSTTSMLFRGTLDRPSGLGQAARVRALLRAGEGDLDGALDAVAEGLAAYERVDLPFDRARLRLLEGGLYRRTRQKRSARDALEDAQRTFLDLGAATFAARAAVELDRVDPGAGGRLGLTPTERRIAGLLAEGRTVKAVAELAFMSPKTVEAHLTRVYRKLGINSRAELGARLAQTSDGHS